MAEIETPCIGICKLDPAGTFCTGCKRTLDEIMRWRAMSDAERRAVMTALPTRSFPI